MKKRPFVLLEILIAFTLVAMCAVPLIRQPALFFRKQIDSFVLLEKERIADWTFTEIKEILLKNEIAWEKIPPKGLTSPPFKLAPASLQIPNCKKPPVKRSFTLHCTGEKPGRNEEIYRSLEINVKLDNDEYKFRIPVQRIVENKKETGHTNET
jgi:hypothetical protein